jgi:hypothetical protein
MLCFIWTGLTLPFFLFCVIMASLGRYEKRKFYKKLKGMDWGDGCED